MLVDDTRLELVTSRTSSGCATSCANRPCLISGSYFNPYFFSCQVFFEKFKNTPAHAKAYSVCRQSSRQRMEIMHGESPFGVQSKLIQEYF